MGRIIGLLVACAGVGLLAPAARAQRAEEFFQRSLFFEKETRDRLEAAMPAEQKTLIEWGGFYIPSYMYFTDL